MSVSTISATLHHLTPTDELIGSLTRERVALAVRYAGAHAAEDRSQARWWLANALNTEVPYSFITLATAFEQREQLQDCDLDFWYGIPNTEANRLRLEAKADDSIEYCVEYLSAKLCAQLELTA
jgi:hypothetical protein